MALFLTKISIPAQFLGIVKHRVSLNMRLYTVDVKRLSYILDSITHIRVFIILSLIENYLSVYR